MPFRPATAARVVVPLVLLASLSGCLAFGPRYHGQVTIPPPTRSSSGQTIVVSPFVQSERQLSVTFSANVASLLESASVHDISMEVANSLRAKGISAEARADVVPARLAPNELLLRGAFVATGGHEKNMGLYIGVAAITLFMVGIVVPSPVFIENGMVYVYRVELVDPRGNILVQTGQQELVGYYKTNYLGRKGDRKRMFGEAKQQVFDGIERMIRGTAVQAGTPRP